ncbi:MAG: TonB-dependent receptor [Balneolaceae bacterium]|nr:MAG: TonB-dependent receptor [Balneolaceae bacterium]
MKRILLLLNLILFTSPLPAQITAELDSITISASRITSDISESGKSVSVISPEQILSSGSLSVDELLRSLPGVNINARQGFGVQADVGIRGSTYSQVLFMLDNIPLNDPLTGHFNTNIPVALTEIGQIELIRGPAAASFGSDAVGGVIHIKTKGFLQRERAGGDDATRFASTIDVSGGQHGLRIADVSASRSARSLDVSAAVRYAASDGESFANPAYDQGLSADPGYNTYFNLFNATAALAWRPGNHNSFFIRTGFDTRDFNARYFYTLSPFDESTEEIQSRWILSAFTRELGKHRSEVHASFRSTDDRFDFNSAITPANEHTTELRFLNGSHQITLNPAGPLSRGRVMGGVQLVQKSIVSTDRGNHSTFAWGAYTIGSFRLGERLDLNPALRLQFDPNNHTTLLPQLSLAWHLNRLTLRGSAGRATRTADFTELHISSEIESLTPLRNRGNPSLAPETSWSLDAGADWNAGGQAGVSGSFFYRSSSDLIDYVLTNADQIPIAGNLIPGELYFFATNIARAKTYGFESAAFSVISLPGSRSLRLDAGYTRIVTGGVGDTLSRYIANHPSHQLSLRLRLTTGSSQLISESEIQVRDYETLEAMDAAIPGSLFLTHLRLERQFLSAGNRVYLSVRNVTNVRWQEILGAPMPGRWVLAGMRFQL